MFGSHALKTWSSTQQVVSLSSGESELYALVKGAAQAKGLCAMLREYGVQVDAEVHTDATAAIGMVFRQDHSGRTRHIETAYLWVQDEVLHKRLTACKVGSAENPADLLTKALSANNIERHLYTLDFKTSDSKSESALTL